MWGERPTRTVPAEYPYLKDKSVAIAVWTDLDTQVEFPHARLELAEHLKAAMDGSVTGAKFIPIREIVDYQNRDLDWDRADPAQMGEELGADRLVLVELSDFTTREADSPHLYRGRISANVKVYDTAVANSRPAFRKLVETSFPPEGPAEWGASDRAVRRGVMEAFATEVAGLFHDRKEEIK